MTEKKLYKVEVSFTYYAATPSEEHATAMVKDVLADVAKHGEAGVETFATEVRYRDTELSEGWKPESVPYVSDFRDRTFLCDWLSVLPTRAEAAEADE